jgi:hypothetical protein
MPVFTCDNIELDSTLLYMLTVSVIRATIQPIFCSSRFEYFFQKSPYKGGNTHEKMQHVEKSMDCFVGRIRPSHCPKHGLRRRPCDRRPPETAECGTGQGSGCYSSDSGSEITQ